MKAYFNFAARAVAYTDKVVNSNPTRRAFDWARDAVGVLVSNPKTFSPALSVGGSTTVFDGSKTTSIDGTTTFAVTQSSLDATRYRITAVSGTSPAFRVDRALTLSGSNVTVVVNSNATATWTINAGTFVSVQAGDTVYVPGPVTGDGSSPFNTLNQGFWTVLSVNSTTSLTLVRPATQVFSAAAEGPIALTSNTQLQAFAASGVLGGDSVQISAGFSAANQTTFVVDTVTPKWIEVLSSSPLALDTAAVPTATGMLFYSGAKRFMRIESDQEVVVQLNGDTSSAIRITPFVPADPEQVGWFEILGPVYKLTLVNKSLADANVTVFSVEG